jgi:hypothetical protein
VVDGRRVQALRGLILPHGAGLRRSPEHEPHTSAGRLARSISKLRDGLPVTAEDDRNEPAFGRIAAALDHADRTRWTLPVGWPAQERLWDEESARLPL